MHRSSDVPSSTLQTSPWVTVLLSSHNARLQTLPQIGLHYWCNSRHNRVGVVDVNRWIVCTCRISIFRTKMAVTVFRLFDSRPLRLNKTSMNEQRHTSDIKLVYFVYFTTSIPKIRHQIPWKVHPDRHVKRTQAQMHPARPVMTLSQLFHVIVATSRALWRHSSWWHDIVDSPCCFPIATVVRPCRIPLDLELISLFMWDFLKFWEEIIGICELSSLKAPGTAMTSTRVEQFTGIIYNMSP
jgi:hypothetical protein